MALSKPLLDKLRKRDKMCWDCGEINDLIPHHRKNRKMGGSKLLDRLDNLLLVCADYNGLMESDARTASQARDFGHKLASWDDFSNPVFDKINLLWYVLDDKGNKTEVEAPQYLI